MRIRVSMMKITGALLICLAVLTSVSGQEQTADKLGSHDALSQSQIEMVSKIFNDAIPQTHSKIQEFAQQQMTAIENRFSTEMKGMQAQIESFKQLSHQAISTTSQFGEMQKQLISAKQSLQTLADKVKQLELENTVLKENIEQLKESFSTLSHSSWQEWANGAWEKCNQRFDVVFTFLKQQCGWLYTKCLLFNDQYLQHLWPLVIQWTNAAIEWSSAVHKRWRPVLEHHVQNIRFAVKDNTEISPNHIDSFITVETVFAVAFFAVTLFLRLGWELCCRRSKPKESQSFKTSKNDFKRS